MDGVILINKEKGCTSHDVVSKVKHLLNEKVGHTGTLDPNATGLLPILVGQGTKLSYYLINHDKKYEVTLKLGIKTDTADAEGKTIVEQNVDKAMLDKAEIEKVLSSFVGKQKQVPPMYSAIKVNGKKLYEYARKNINVEIQPREIEIYTIELNEINEEKHEIKFVVECSKGTYIRSLCEDIAEKLGTVGYMKELNRTKVGMFDMKDSIKIEELEENKENTEFLKQHIISVEDLFIKLYGEENKVTLNEKKLGHFLNGVRLTFDLPDGEYRVYNEEGAFIGTGSVRNKLLKREIVTWISFFSFWGQVSRRTFLRFGDRSRSEKSLQKYYNKFSQKNHENSIEKINLIW